MGTMILANTEYVKIMAETALGSKPAGFDAGKLTTQVSEVKASLKRALIENKATRQAAGKWHPIIGRPEPELGFSCWPMGTGVDPADGVLAPKTFNDVLFETILDSTNVQCEATTIKTATVPTVNEVELAGGEVAPPVIGGHLAVTMPSGLIEMAPILDIGAGIVTLAAGLSAAPAAEAKLLAVNTQRLVGTRLQRSHSLYAEIVGLLDEDSGEIGGWVPNLEMAAAGAGDLPEYKVSGPGVTMVIPEDLAAPPDRTAPPAEQQPVVNADGRLSIAVWDGTDNTSTALEYWQIELKVGGKLIKKGSMSNPNANASALLMDNEISVTIHVPIDDDCEGAEASWRDKILAGPSGDLVAITRQNGTVPGHCEALTIWGLQVASWPEPAEVDGIKVLKVALELNPAAAAPCIVSRSAA